MTDSTLAFNFIFNLFDQAERRQIRQQKRGRGRKYVRRLKEWQPPPGAMEDDFDYIPLRCGCGSYHLYEVTLDPRAASVSDEGDTPINELFDELVFNLQNTSDPAEEYEILRRIDRVLSITF